MDHDKKSLALTTKQRSLIIGSLLGDGTMRLGENAINANFKVEHGLAQKDYVLWKRVIAYILTKKKQKS